MAVFRKRSNWLISFGLLFILVGSALFWLAYRHSQASPFDIVEAEESNFLPILELDGIPEQEGAPTMEYRPAPFEGAPVTEGEHAAVVEEISSPVQGKIPTRLVIPSIGLDAPIVPVHYKAIQTWGKTYRQWLVPQEFAVGWQDESALLGLPGNTVLNGHHNAYGMVFKNLAQVKSGDEIFVYAETTLFRYIAAARLLLPERGEMLETRLENARWLLPSEDERLTLVSCWPADSNTHRLIVVAFPASYSPLPPPATEELANPPH